MTEAVVSQLPKGTLAFSASYRDGDGVLLLSVFLLGRCREAVFLGMHESELKCDLGFNSSLFTGFQVKESPQSATMAIPDSRSSVANYLDK